MFFVMLVLAFFAAFVAHNTWTRIKWRFGFMPIGHDAEQAHIVCKEMSLGLVEHLKQNGEWRPDTSPEDEDELVGKFYGFARQVVFAYTHKLQVPSHDITRDPPGIRARRVQCGEIQSGGSHEVFQTPRARRGPAVGDPDGGEVLPSDSWGREVQIDTELDRVPDDDAPGVRRVSPRERRSRSVKKLNEED